MTRFQYQSLIVALLIVLVGVIGGAAYFFGRSSNSPEAEASREVADTVEAVGKLIVLPEGEQPTVATVSSLEQLAGQPFFVNAKIGHKVLIYTKAQKEILYDPESGKLVEVAPLNINPQ